MRYSMKKLPYTVTSATGDVIQIEFPLDTETIDAVRVSQLVTSFLQTIEDDVSLAGHINNGDLLQAIAMTLAIRTGMIHTAPAQAAQIAEDLLHTALGAITNANWQSGPAGHA